MWWDRAIRALVPAALVAAMIAYVFPFQDPNPGSFSSHSDAGIANVVIGFVGVTSFLSVPTILYFGAFSLPLIAAFVGVVYQRRSGWFGSAAPLICTVVGFVGLGAAYFWEQDGRWALGFYAAEAGFLIAAAASAARLIRLRRNPALWDEKAPQPDEPAASAQQQLVGRYLRRP